MNKYFKLCIIWFLMLFLISACGDDSNRPFADYGVGEYIAGGRDTYIMKLPHDFVLYAWLDVNFQVYKIDPVNKNQKFDDSWLTEENLIISNSYLEGSFTDDKLFFHDITRNSHDRYYEFDFATCEITQHKGYLDFLSSENCQELKWFDINKQCYEEHKCRMLAVGNHDNLEHLIKAIQSKRETVKWPVYYRYLDDGRTIYIEFVMYWPTKDAMLNNLWLTDISLAYDADIRVLEYCGPGRKRTYCEVKGGELVNIDMEIVSLWYNFKKDDLVPDM